MAKSSGRGAVLVGLGILASRLMGLVRTKVFAHMFGTGVEAAAFQAALSIPNFLQNLLGEGVLSASFIPTYAALRARGEEEAARRVAGAVFGLLLLAVSVLTALGITFADPLVTFLAPGFSGGTRQLTVDLVRIIFPGTAVLVLSAWCLGILNSHRRFFLSYAAPVLWNLAIIAALLGSRGQSPAQAVVWVAWGAVAGSVLQLVLQLPLTLKVLGGFKPSLSTAEEGTRDVARKFGPAVLGRGVVQFSSYVDRAYATLITERAVAALTNAQIIALLPVSLFGMAISAAELPALSEEAATGREARVAALRERLLLGLERIAFFVVPSAVAFLLVGDLVAMPLLQSGRFTAADTRLTWYILIGASVGLLAQTQGRLYSSAFYALNDTRTPLKIATLRVVVGAVVGYGAVRLLPTALGLPAELGVAFITGTSGVVAWLEYALLRRALAREVGDVGLSPGRALVLLGCAGAAGASALGFKLALTWRFGADAAAAAQWGGGALAAPALAPMAVGLSGLLLFALVYGGLTLAARVPQATNLWRRIRRRG